MKEILENSAIVENGRAPTEGETVYVQPKPYPWFWIRPVLCLLVEDARDDSVLGVALERMGDVGFHLNHCFTDVPRGGVRSPLLAKMRFPF